MKKAAFEYILRVVSSTNVLPITSRCNINCIFCSHKNNPDNIKTYYVEDLDLEEVAELIEYLSTGDKIVIGESASRIVEGEPFLHKDIMYILKAIREKYKFTQIQITTNGSFFTENIIFELSQIGMIEINLSLNSSSCENRKILINDKNPQVAIESCKLLKKYNIPYNGSLVVMPNVVGWEDISSTIKYLCQNNAQTVRVFIPGATKYGRLNVDLEELYEQTAVVVNEIRREYDTPIVIEPPIIKNLDAVIEGVIKNSPSDIAGLRQGDIIDKVNGKKVLTRVDAYNEAFRLVNPVLEIRDGDKVKLIKEAKSSAGFVVQYDIDSAIVKEIDSVVLRNNSKRPLIITSELACTVFELLLNKELGRDIRIISIKNNFFGGNIKSSGLLTVEDIIEQIKELTNKDNIDLLILPSIIFDYNYEDIKGKSYLQIEDIVGIKTEII